MKRLVIAIALLAISMPALAVRIECITANTIQTDGNCTAADTPWDCCTGSGTGNCNDLSATAIHVKGGNRYTDIEIYSTADIDPDEAGGAPPAPVTCEVGGDITCAGWDTSGAAEIWTKCDRRAPWLRMNLTSTYTAAPIKVGATFESDCLVALKVTDTGSGGDVCLYLAVTNEGGLKPTDSAATTVQDGSAKGSWAEVIP